MKSKSKLGIFYSQRFSPQSRSLNYNEHSLKDAIINKRVRTPTDNEQAYILEVLERWLKLHAA